MVFVHCIFFPAIYSWARIVWMLGQASLWVGSPITQVILTTHAVWWGPFRMHKHDDVILLPSSRLKRGKWGGAAAANPSRSRSVWVIQAGCGGFRDGPNPVKGCHWKVWIVCFNLNTKHMAGWESDYLKAVSHISLCVCLISASQCSIRLQVDCLLCSDKGFHVSPWIKWKLNSLSQCRQTFLYQIVLDFCPHISYF